MLLVNKTQTCCIILKSSEELPQRSDATIKFTAQVSQAKYSEGQRSNVHTEPGLLALGCTEIIDTSRAWIIDTHA